MLLFFIDSYIDIALSLQLLKHLPYSKCKEKPITVAFKSNNYTDSNQEKKERNVLKMNQTRLKLITCQILLLKCIAKMDNLIAQKSYCIL